MRRTDTKPRKPAVNTEASHKATRKEAGPNVPPAVRPRQRKDALPRSSKARKPACSRPTLLRGEALVKCILTETAIHDYKTNSVLQLLADPLKVEDRELEALNEAFKRALRQKNDFQALRIAAVFLASIPTEQADRQRNKAWCRKFLELALDGSLKGVFVDQALLLAQLRRLAHQCKQEGLARELSADVPLYVRLAISSAAKTGAAELRRTLKQLKANLNLRACLSDVMQESMQCNDVATALLVAKEYLKRIPAENSRWLDAFRSNFSYRAGKCAPQLQIELLEGASRLCLQCGQKDLAQAFRMEAGLVFEDHWQRTADMLDSEISKASLDPYDELDGVYEQLECLTGSASLPTLERKFTAMSAALSRCLANLDGLDRSANQEPRIILNVLTDLLKNFPPERELGSLLYQLMEKETRHWTYSERAKLLMLAAEIAEQHGVWMEAVSPEQQRMERAIDTSDTALFRELASIPETTEPAAFTGFQLLAHALESSLCQPGDLQERRVNRILVAIDDQLKTLEKNEYDVSIHRAELYYMLVELTLDYPKQDWQRVRELAEAVFSS